MKFGDLFVTAAWYIMTKRKEPGEVRYSFTEKVMFELGLGKLMGYLCVNEGNRDSRQKE